MKLIFPDGHEIEIASRGRTIEAIIQEQGLNPLELLVSRDGEIIPEDTIGNDSDSIRLIRISHGG
ncbi:MAG TPA: thiamine S protein [Methanospirillum sp.]|uniref:thiamine S protein n=1 Tax=Methanospirillum sp. TaxID=45200 RepID=UPI002CFA0EFB|nr:thiamine S protein [Methanospirillum sp.]HWQ64747.1 thiamine S protein [Methanospirillum sp.]